MRYSTQLLAFIVILTFPVAAWAVRGTVDLDVEMVAWQRVVVLVGTVEQTGINTECTVRIARVLHGKPTLEGRAVPVRFDLDVPKTAGDYLLLCEWNGDTLVLGANTLQLGPIQGYWPLPSVTDPLIADLQLIVDTARIATPGVKWQRLQELAVQTRGRALVQSYVALAAARMTDAMLQELDHSLVDLMKDANTPPTTLVQVDKILTGQVGNYLPFAYQAKNTWSPAAAWGTSATRKTLFTSLAKRPLSDEEAKYVQQVLRAFAER